MKMSRNVRENFYGWLLISPFVLSIVVFFLFALVRTIAYSFSQYDLFTSPEWTGMSNYVKLFSDPLFIRASANTITFSFIVTSIQTVLAMGLAVLLNSEIRAKGFFRTVYYIPSIMSSSAITLIFIWIYQKNGFLNSFLSSIATNMPFITGFLLAMLTAQIVFVLYSRAKGKPVGWFDPIGLLIAALIALVLIQLCSGMGLIEGDPTKYEISWLGTRDMVGPMPLTLWAIVLQNIFTTVPTLMLLFLAGLQGISGDLYEAAEIDGANKWQQTIHITVPQLAPVTFVVITMGMIGTLQMFDQVALLGGGVPLESRITLAYYVYHYAFPDGSSPQIGIASAAALVLGMLTIALVILQKKIGVKEHVDS